MQPVARPFDVVVTTNSGYPLDLNLYQSVKGMSAAARIVRRGGATSVPRSAPRDPGTWRVPQASGLDCGSRQFSGSDPPGRRHHARPVAGPDPEPDPAQGPRPAEIGRVDPSPDSERPPGTDWDLEGAVLSCWTNTVPRPASASCPRDRRPFPTWTRQPDSRAIGQAPGQRTNWRAKSFVSLITRRRRTGCPAREETSAEPCQEAR